jgi:tRNA threonylcarbamoyladenosine biosynthesis protein TsaB
MNTVLAIDTSGPLCSLAVHVDGQWIEHTQAVERLHNQVVLVQLESLLAEVGVARNDFDAVVFAAGPGSFTGIRIAAALTQGVAFASSAVVLPISSSLALAVAGGLADADFDHQPLITVTRSRRDAHYVAGYVLDDAGSPLCCLPDRLVQGDTLPAVLGDAANGLDVLRGVGDRPLWWPSAWSFRSGVRLTATVLGRLALPLLARGEGRPPAAALPIYVDGDYPWRRASG